MKKIIIEAGILAIVAILIFSFAGREKSEFSYDIKKFSSAEDMRNFIEKSSKELSEGSGYEFGFSKASGGVAVAEASASSGSADSGTGLGRQGQTGARAGGLDYSQTNIQVEGVDEQDIIKTDGEYIYVASGQSVLIAKAHENGKLEEVSKLEYEGFISGIFINGNKLAVLGSEASYVCPECDKKIASPESVGLAITPYQETSFVRVYDVSDRSNPELVNEILYEGWMHDSRMIGEHVYIVANQPIYYADKNIGLPRIMENSRQEQVDASEIAYFDFPDYSYQLTTIFGINLNNNEIKKSTFMTGSTQNIYVSENNIYLVSAKYVSYKAYQELYYDEVILPVLSSDLREEAKKAFENEESYYEGEQKVQEIVADYYNSLSEEEKSEFTDDFAERHKEASSSLARELHKTVIHRIEIDNGKAEYKAKGEVPGNVLNQFSMDEHDKYFRIATTVEPIWLGYPTIFGGNKNFGAESENVQENNVYALDLRLSVVGRLEGLASGERIYSARFMGDRLYLVTFRQVDPLFVIDLSSPSKIEVLGELKIPGFSNYLHPYDEKHIIGIGMDTEDVPNEWSEQQITIPSGLKLALFDVSDVNNPREIARYFIGERGSYSLSLYDHKAFLFSKERDLMVIPASVREKSEQGKSSWDYGKLVFEGAYVFELSPSKGFELKGRVTHLSESEQARLSSSGEYYSYNAQIQRSLYIGDVLYTLSQKSLMASNLNTFENIDMLELEREFNYGTYAAGSAGRGFAGIIDANA